MRSGSIFLFLFGIVNLAWGDAQNLSPREAFEWIHSGQESDLTIIDVRTGDEFSDGYVAGAVNIDILAVQLKV